MITLHVPHFKSIIYLEKCSQKSDVLSGRKKHGCDEGTRNTGSQGSWYFSSVCRAVLVVSKTALFTHQKAVNLAPWSDHNRPPGSQWRSESLCLLWLYRVWEEFEIVAGGHPVSQTHTGCRVKTQFNFSLGSFWVCDSLTHRLHICKSNFPFYLNVPFLN